MSAYIGRGAENIKAATNATGVIARATALPNVSRLQAALIPDIDLFVAMCRLNAPGIEYRIVSSKSVRVVHRQ